MPGFGRNRWELKRHVVATDVDNWMLASGLDVVLGEFVRRELSYALALVADTNWFMGTGQSTDCGYTGLFKTDEAQVVQGDAGDDTLDELVAKSVHYLGLALGTLPLWAHMAGPRWFMHLLLFFKYLGVRDSNGQPIANIIQAPDRPPFMLMGYPVEPVQVAPTQSAVSTTFVLLTALSRACRVYRHRKAISFKSTDQLKWLEGETTFATDVPQDRVVYNPDAIVQIKTAAS